MSRLFCLVVGVVVGCVGAYGSLNYHLLRTTQGFELVPKAETSLTETYVDIRNFHIGDWTEHKVLAADVIRARKEYLMQAAADTSVKDQIGKVMTNLVPR